MKDHLDYCSRGGYSDEGGKKFKCCGFINNSVDCYTHIIESHCENLPKSIESCLKPISEYERNQKKQKENGIEETLLGEGDEYGSASVLENTTSILYNTLNLPIQEIFSKVDKSDDLFSEEIKVNLGNDFLQGFKKNAFACKEEIYCFILVNHFHLSKEGYIFLLRMLEYLVPKKYELFPCYDTLTERKKTLVNDQCETGDGFTYVTKENSIQSMLSDESIVKNMCLTRKQYDARDKNENQPYNTQIFKECVAKCPPDAFPFVYFEYFDDYAKFRTKQMSTCGSYFTSYNFNSNFISSLSAIRVNGFSWNSEGFWRMNDKVIGNDESLDGKIMNVKVANIEEPIKLFMCLIGFLLDTPERMKCLALMKSECSRCLDASEYLGKTPSFIVGSESFNPICVHTFKRRNHSEMMEIVSKVETIPINTDAKQNRKDRKGAKAQFWEEEKLKNTSLSNNKRKKLLRIMQKTPIKSKFVMQTVLDPYRGSFVDFFHLEIQGLFRTHLKLLIGSLEHATAMDDLILSSNKYTLPNGDSLNLRLDIDTISGTDMLDFIIMSAPMIYELIYANPNVTITSELKSSLYQSWILHLQYFVKLLRGNNSKEEITECQKLFAMFQSYFTLCFGEEKCNFPNYHWASHIFEDCSLFGDVKWFWALLFELKHSQFKQFNDRSNKKMLEIRGLEHEMAINTLFAQYPFTRELLNKTLTILPTTTIRKGMYILFDRNNSKYVGRVSMIGNDSICCDLVYVIGMMNLHNFLYQLYWDENLSNLQVLKQSVHCICSCLTTPSPNLFLNQFSFCLNYYK